MKKETPINFHDLLGDGWVDGDSRIDGHTDSRHFIKKHSNVQVIFWQNKFLVSITEDTEEVEFPGCQTMEQLRSLEKMLKP